MKEKIGSRIAAAALTGTLAVIPSSLSQTDNSSPINGRTGSSASSNNKGSTPSNASPNARPTDIPKLPFPPSVPKTDEQTTITGNPDSLSEEGKKALKCVLNETHPMLKEALVVAYKKMEAQKTPLTFKVTACSRTEAEQVKAVTENASQVGCEESPHCREESLAVDFIAINRKTKKFVGWDDKEAFKEVARNIRDIAKKERDITLGGGFQWDWDECHLELGNGKYQDKKNWKDYINHKDGAPQNTPQGSRGR